MENNQTFNGEEFIRKALAYCEREGIKRATLSNKLFSQNAYTLDYFIEGRRRPALATLLRANRILAELELGKRSKVKKGPLLGHKRERDLQIASMKWLNKNLRNGVAFHVPNEEKDMLTVIEKNRQGVLRGVFDICVLTDKGTFFAEAKSRTGRMSPAQVAFGEKLDALGIPWVMFRTVKQLSDFLASNDVKLKKSSEENSPNSEEDKKGEQYGI